MLVLTRRREEALMIGDDVEIVVVDIRGDKVRLGIRAPDSVNVHRKEVFELIRKANRDASSVRPEDFAGLPAGVLAKPPLTATASEPSSLPEDRASTTDPFLQAALAEAKLGLAEGGLPIGAVLVRGDEIIGRGHNRQMQIGNPTTHAEIDCIGNAGMQKTYKDTVLYSTLMPCHLCSGAAVQFGVSKVVVGESVNMRGGEVARSASTSLMRSHGIEVVELNDPECVEMMGTFAREHPELWKV